MTTTTFAYRDSLEGARLRYSELLSLVRDDSAVSDACRVCAARTGRAWAGAAGIAGAAAMALSSSAVLMTRQPSAPTPTECLLLSWPTMGAAYAAGWIVGKARAKRAAALSETGDLHADLARLERANPVADSRALAAGLGRAGVALPMIAVALLAPLTIHLVLYLFGGGTVGGFDEWIRMSLVIVGHAHLALAAYYWKFAGLASESTRWVSSSWMDDDQIRKEAKRMTWAAFGVVVGVSAVPGAVLLLIPPLLTAVTALFFHPLLCCVMTRTILRERAALS
jgi:hypothetical protein